MITLVDGTPGGGKTYRAMRIIADSLADGKCVVTNCGLQPDWSLTVARMNPARRLAGGRAVRRRAAEYERRLFSSTDLSELFRVRVPGNDEGRVVMVLDEAHRWMNSRMWSAKGQNRQEIIDWFTAHRHYGFDVYLLTQYIEMIDKQVRVLVEYRTRVRNLRRERVAGVRLFPFNLFVAITELEGSKAKRRQQTDFYMLNRRIRGMYDTHALSQQDAPTNAIWLPRAASARQEAEAPPDGGGGGPGREPGGPAALPERESDACPTPLDEAA